MIVLSVSSSPPSRIPKNPFAQPPSMHSAGLAINAPSGPLILALKDPHKHVRALAAEALGHLADPLAIEPLVKALDDREWDVREAAIFSLGRFRDPQAVDALLPLLRDADREVRQATVHALELINDPRALTPLILALIDSEDTVRQAATRALEMIEPSWPRTEFAHQAIPQLKAALKDKEYWVRQSAASALARIGEISQGESDTTMMAEPLYYRRQAAMEAFVEALTDFDRDLPFRRRRSARSDWPETSHSRTPGIGSGSRRRRADGRRPFARHAPNPLNHRVLPWTSRRSVHHLTIQEPTPSFATPYETAHHLRGRALP
jgi:hypothetical protein